ncbi:MAG TPA: HdeD family acid-resistance protein [Terriglobales bacterium]|nr:HdeD family acid-resistance protein [Terriglobales bacterium]
MAQNTPVEMVRHASTVSILWGVLLIVFGTVAIGSPFLAAVAVNVVVAWLIVLAGAVHLMIAFHAHGAGSMIWKLLVGIAYLFFGAYLIMHPVLGVVSLTLILASLFLIEGILDIVLFFKMRPIQGSTWVLVDGIITLLLGLMIYAQWPSSSAWAIGTLVGISMIFSGVARVMMSLAVRKAMDTASASSSSLAA